jgi:hypothetical protein
VLVPDFVISTVQRDPHRRTPEAYDVEGCPLPLIFGSDRWVQWWVWSNGRPGRCRLIHTR